MEIDLKSATSVCSCEVSRCSCVYIIDVREGGREGEREREREGERATIAKLFLDF